MIEATTSQLLSSYPPMYSSGKLKSFPYYKFEILFRPKNLNHQEMTNQEKYKESMAKYSPCGLKEWFDCDVRVCT